MGLAQLEKDVCSHLLPECHPAHGGNSPRAHSHHCPATYEEVRSFPQCAGQRKQSSETACDLLKVTQQAPAPLSPPKPALSWQSPGVYVRGGRQGLRPPARPAPWGEDFLSPSCLPKPQLRVSGVGGTEPPVSCLTERGQEEGSWPRDQSGRRRHSPWDRGGRMSSEAEGERGGWREEASPRSGSPECRAEELGLSPGATGSHDGCRAGGEHDPQAED